MWFERFWPKLRCNPHRHTQAVKHLRGGTEDCVWLTVLHTSGNWDEEEQGTTYLVRDTQPLSLKGAVNEALLVIQRSLSTRFRVHDANPCLRHERGSSG